jgi:hypothetical protein
MGFGHYRNQTQEAPEQPEPVVELTEDDVAEIDEVIAEVVKEEESVEEVAEVENETVEEAPEEVKADDEEVVETEVSYEELNRDELKALADSREIDFPGNVPTKKLVELLEASDEEA